MNTWKTCIKFQKESPILALCAFKYLHDFQCITLLLIRFDTDCLRLYVGLIRKKIIKANRLIVLFYRVLILLNVIPMSTWYHKRQRNFLTSRLARWYVDSSDSWIDLSDNYDVFCMALPGIERVFMHFFLKKWISDKSI